MPHEIACFHWLAKDGWRTTRYPGFYLSDKDVMRNLKTGWTLVVGLNNGQKVHVKCRS